MTKRLWAVLFLAVASTAASAVTTTISPGANLNDAIQNAAAGDIIQLNPGVYVATAPGNNCYAVTGSFGIGKRVTIRGLGATPAQTILRGSATAAGQFAIHFLKYTCGTDPNGAALENVTVDTSQGGIRIHDFASPAPDPNNPPRLADITLKNVVINTTAPGGAFGVLMQNTDRVVIDNVTVTSYQSGFYLINASDSLIMNSTVNAALAPAAPAIGVLGGSNNRIVGNTFGQPKANGNLDSGYSFNTGGTVFYNSFGNRYEDNILQGFRDDGLDYTTIDLTGTVPPPQVLQKSVDNYAGKNTIISTGLDVGLLGGTGLWSNCSSNNNWLFGNTITGSPEGGISVWASKSNMVLGNYTKGHGHIGIFVSGGVEVLGCDVAGGTYAIKPTGTYVRNNAAIFNETDQMIIRSSDNTDISFNFTSPRSSRTGTLQPATDPPNGQAGYSFGTDSRFASSTGFRFVHNTTSENKRGIWNNENKPDTNIEFWLNRVISSTFNRITVPAFNIDMGEEIGGNYWSHFPVNGNPSTTQQFGGVSHDSNNSTGLIIDRYPFQNEDLGRENHIQVFEPRAGVQVAAGSKRTVRWWAPGCSYVDMTIDGQVGMLTDYPNLGYAVVTIPPGIAAAAHNVWVHCKDSAGNLLNIGFSPTFNSTTPDLQLRAPGRDDVLNANSQLMVGWKKSAAVGAVNVSMSVDGGQTFPHSLATGITANFVRVTLPNIAAASNAMIRIQSAAFGDSTDGVFALRGTSPGFTNTTAGRTYVMGSLERLEWSSPVNSRVVDITANGVPIAQGLPDRGYFDWIPKDFLAGPMTLGITYKQTDGTTVISAAGSAAGVTRYATTITLGALNTLVIGASQGLSGTTNSGVGVTFSTTTPSVCTVVGSVANALANGTCVIVANAAGTANYAAAPSVSTSFLVAADPPRLYGISTRMRVLTGDDVMIGGIIIGGATPKTVVVRARGPSLGVPGALANPTMTLVPAAGGPNLLNDDWQTAGNAAQLQASGFAPGHPAESAILATLNPGAYTAIVSGVGNTTGIAIVEVYEIDHPEIPMIGISTRGRVQTGDDVMIGGFIIQGSGPQTVVVRARGPSLGIPGSLLNPTMTIVPAAGGPNLVNDDWQTAPNAASLAASGFAPGHVNESALLVTLNPGAYTAIVSGVGNTTGVAIVEVYVP